MLSGKGYLGDLWRYDGNWTFVKGPEMVNAEGVFGPIEIPDENAYPPSRQFPACWTDNDGNFWLYGGDGNGKLRILNADKP